MEKQGFAVVAQNLRVGRDELDIVARNGPLIAVVEVRLRGAGALTRGFGSLDPKKRLRVRRAGERLWQRRYKNDSSVERLRFDAASCALRRWRSRHRVRGGGVLGSRLRFESPLHVGT